MRAFRRTVTIAVVATVIGAALRLRSTRSQPPARGGWRQLSGQDLS